MSRKILLIVMLFLTMFITSACWDQKETEDQAFVIGLALDKEATTDKIIVTFQIALPQAFVAEAQSDEPFWNVSEEADNITTAEYQLTKIINQVPT